MSKETHPLSIHGLLHNKINLFKQSATFEVSTRYIDTVLEEAMQIVYEVLVDKAELNQRVNEDLRPLVVDGKKITFVRTDGISNVYQVPQDFFRMKRCYLKATKPGCSERIIRLWKARANEINNLLLDSNWNPSFQWQTAFYDTVSEGIRVFHNNMFDIGYVITDYYKTFTPIRCAAGEDSNFYTWYDGSKESLTTSSEFTANYILRRITDVAALIVHRDKNNGADFQQKLQALVSFENLYN